LRPFGRLPRKKISLRSEIKRYKAVPSEIKRYADRFVPLKTLAAFQAVKLQAQPPWCEATKGDRRRQILRLLDSSALFFSLKL
jgi:hypothetical protein